MIDLLGILRRIMNSGAGETFDPATDSLEALRDFLAAMGGGLTMDGTVTAVPGANQFTIPTLAGMGAGAFADATAPWWAIVFRDAGGLLAAPQGEMQPITGYVTATGDFTTPAFTVPVAVGDEIIIMNPVLAAIGRRIDAAALDSMANLATDSLIAEVKRILLRMSTNAFTATIQGGARVELDTMMEQIATYFVAAGAAMALQINGNAARTNLQQAVTDLAAVFGADGANVFNPTIQGVAQTNLDAALSQFAIYFAAAGAALAVTMNPGAGARANLQLILQDLADMLAGGTGIVTWPVRAKAGNTVSMAEAVRDIDEMKPEWSGPTSATHTTAGATEETIFTTSIIVAGYFNMDLSLRNMVAGDDFTFRIYKRADGVNFDLMSEQQFLGAPTIKIYSIRNEFFEVTDQLRVTVQRASGTNRSFPYLNRTLQQPVV